MEPQWEVSHSFAPSLIVKAVKILHCVWFVFQKLSFRGLKENFLRSNKQPNQIVVSPFLIQEAVPISFRSLLITCKLPFKPGEDNLNIQTRHSIFSVFALKVRGGEEEWFSYPAEVPITISLVPSYLLTVEQYDSFVGMTYNFDMPG